MSDIAPTASGPAVDNAPAVVVQSVPRPAPAAGRFPRTMNKRQRDQLTRLLAHYERLAHALRTTIALLDADDTGAARPAGPPAPAAPPRVSAAVRARRRLSAAILAEFHLTEPRPRPAGANVRVVASLLRHQYLKRAGRNRYLRTGKNFTP